MLLRCRDQVLDLTQPQVMGILNITPDSFSDGGNFFFYEKALHQARSLVREGAAIIDVGGESTRPGASMVSVQEELDRVIPVIEAICKECPVIVSIDTSKPEVMRAAVAAGAGIINDVFALQKEGALQAAVQTGAAICLMHMQGTPQTMQINPSYENVTEDTKLFLWNRVQACLDVGISLDQIIIDPGFGFGKSQAQNLELFTNLTAFLEMNLPVLVGVSRKSFIGNLTGRPVTDRLYGSLALAALAVWQGALIVRVHDVAATVDVLKVCSALLDVRSNS